MKTAISLVLTILVSTSLFAAVVPERVVTQPLSLFSSTNRTLSNGDVEVSVTGWDRKGNFKRAASRKVLTKTQYEAFRNLALPVLEMDPSLRKPSDRGNRHGTAFHIGNNLVITNHHVLDPSMESFACGDFQVKSNDGNVFRCKKVHYCSKDKEQDLCLVEMKTILKRDCLFCGDVREVALADGPSLKLKSFYYPLSTQRPKELLTAIGNSAGFGIHLSQGTGMSFIQQRLLFYAPITGGNSGGALLNNKGEVVGVVRAQSTNILSSNPDKTYNVALPSEIAIRLIRDGLTSDPETLEKFNQAVVE